MIHLLKRAACVCASLLALSAALPAMAADCSSTLPAGYINPAVIVGEAATLKVCTAISNPALAASGVTGASTTLTSSTVWQPTFAYVPGRTFYLTLGGTGSGTVTVVYSRDSWSTYAPEVTGVDGSAPITMNKIAYAGTQVVIPLSVSEANVKVGILPATLTGSVTAAFSQ